MYSNMRTLSVQFDFSWGSLQRSPYPLAGFQGAYLSREREGGEERRGKGRGGRGKGSTFEKKDPPPSSDGCSGYGLV